MKQILRILWYNPFRGIHLLGGYVWKKLQRIRKYKSFEWERNIWFSSPALRRKIWKQKFWNFTDKPSEALENSSSIFKNDTTLSYAQTMDYNIYLPSDILLKVDILSMYHGLEVRTPFIDLNIFRCARKIPENQKLERGIKGELIAKSILRKILLNYMPQVFVYRRKQGFVPPYGSWFLPGKLGRKNLEKILENPDSHLHQWFNEKIIVKHLEDQAAGNDRSLLLWLFLILGIWSEMNKDIVFE